MGLQRDEVICRLVVDLVVIGTTCDVIGALVDLVVVLIGLLVVVGTTWDVMGALEDLEVDLVVEVGLEVELPIDAGSQYLLPESHLASILLLLIFTSSLQSFFSFL